MTALVHGVPPSLLEVYTAKLGNHLGECLIAGKLEMSPLFSEFENVIEKIDAENNNLLLTEREGRTGEYWPEVVAVRTERSEVRTKRPRANIPRYGSS